MCCCSERTPLRTINDYYITKLFDCFILFNRILKETSLPISFQILLIAFAVIGSFPGNGDIVRMAFDQSRVGDPRQSGLRA